MMEAAIGFGVFLVVSSTVILWSILHKTPSAPPCKPPEPNGQLIELERRVHAQAEEIRKVANEESGVFSLEEQLKRDESARNPLSDSAVMKSISEKADTIRRLSDEV